jgi:choline-sulfatase
MRPAGCAGDGDLKYVYVAGHDEELFDLAADPDELVARVIRPPHPRLTRPGRTSFRRFYPDDIERRIRGSLEDRRVVPSAMAASGAVWA